VTASGDVCLVVGHEDRGLTAAVLAACDQVAFIPPTAWEGETVARFAFLHPHTSMDLVREILDRMA